MFCQKKVNEQDENEMSILRFFNGQSTAYKRQTDVKSSAIAKLFRFFFNSSDLLWWSKQRCLFALSQPVGCYKHVGLPVHAGSRSVQQQPTSIKIGKTGKNYVAQFSPQPFANCRCFQSIYQAANLFVSLSAYILMRFALSTAYDHTTLNTPHLVRSGKLSNVGPGQYLDG